MLLNHFFIVISLRAAKLHNPDTGMDRWTDGQTEGRSDGLSDQGKEGRMDLPIFFAALFLLFSLHFLSAVAIVPENPADVEGELKPFCEETRSVQPGDGSRQSNRS